LHDAELVEPAFDDGVMQQACDDIDIIAVFGGEAGAGTANNPIRQGITVCFFVVQEEGLIDDVEENKYHGMSSQGTVSDVPSTVEACAIAKKKKNPDENAPLF
jgi:hypothetical protein